MSEALIGSLIVAAVNIIVALLTASKSQAVMEAKFEANTKRVDEKFNDIKEEIKGVREETKKHNECIERTYKLEGRMNEAEHDIRDIKAKI